MKRILILFALCLVGLAHAAWSYHTTLTYDHTKCGAADSSNFTAVLDITDTRLKTVGNSGLVTDAQGDDIELFTDATLATPLSYEIETWDGTTGHLRMWMKIATLSHTANGTVELAIGNAAVTTFQGGAAGSAYDASLQAGAVWHFPDGSGLSLSDSSGGANTLTGHGGYAAASGHIDGGVSIDGAAGSYLSNASFGNYTSGAFTLSTWVKCNSLSADCPLFFKGQYQTYGYYTDIAPDGTVVLITNQSGAHQVSTTNAGAITTGMWFRVSFVRSGASVKIYINGADATTTSGTHSDPTASPDAFEFGDYGAGILTLNGVLDEATIATTNRSSSWETAEFNNQNDPVNGGSFWINTSPAPNHKQLPLTGVGK